MTIATSIGSPSNTQNIHSARNSYPSTPPGELDEAVDASNLFAIAPHQRPVPHNVGRIVQLARISTDDAHSASANFLTPGRRTIPRHLDTPVPALLVNPRDPPQDDQEPHKRGSLRRRPANQHIHAGPAPPARPSSMPLPPPTRSSAREMRPR
ncbi:hypothetical protein VTK56DRAFT_9993 [Thermocarpiscus australiensis]